jgi:hypothetical protein
VPRTRNRSGAPFGEDCGATLTSHAPALALRSRRVRDSADPCGPALPQSRLTCLPDAVYRKHLGLYRLLSVANGTTSGNLIRPSRRMTPGPAGRKPQQGLAYIRHTPPEAWAGL